MKTMIEFKKDCKGVRLVNRGKDDNHICLEILTEDDGQWFADKAGSSYWIDELIEALQEARDYIRTQEPDGDYGFKFKSK